MCPVGCVNPLCSHQDTDACLKTSGRLFIRHIKAFQHHSNVLHLHPNHHAPPSNLQENYRLDTFLSYSLYIWSFSQRTVSLSSSLYLYFSLTGLTT